MYYDYNYDNYHIITVANKPIFVKGKLLNELLQYPKILVQLRLEKLLCNCAA